MSNDTKWADVLAWAAAEIDHARTTLETADAIEILPLQARIAVLRELRTIKNAPAKPDIPGPVAY